MVDPKRREMFTELYRLAEYYEKPPFKPGDIDGNANWFELAQGEQMLPFMQKWKNDKMALSLAEVILMDASDRAAAMNRKERV